MAKKEKMQNFWVVLAVMIVWVTQEEDGPGWRQEKQEEVLTVAASSGLSDWD